MSTISSTSSSSANRITGLYSGIDTDSMVEKLMEVEKTKLNKLYQKQQLAEWRQEAYREITTAIKSFSDKYFNVLKTGSCMLSQTLYKSYATTSSNESVVKVTAGTSATESSHTVTVSNLATSAVYKSNTGISSSISAASAADYTSAAGKDLILELDGEEYTITITDGTNSVDELQSLIDTTVGSGKVSAGVDSEGKLTISEVAGSGIACITLSDGTDSALAALGFSTGSNLSNRLSTSDSLEEISEKLDIPFEFDSEGKINLSINGVDFKFEQTDSLGDMMSEINNSNAGVTMKYNTISDTFTITANSTGAGNRINISETGSSFLSTTGITDNYTAGEDAAIYLDGEKVTRSSNSIKLDGVTYELLAESADPVSVSVSLDTDSIYSTIESFINDYNTLIDTINDKISEEYDSDYPPLTSDQKEEMSEDEIENWEEKAKTGILRNDSILESLLTNMRSALYSSVGGLSKSLYNIGITTSSDYSDKGKLVIDEETLRESIENDPDMVMKLFSQESETYPGTTTVRTLNSTERAVRSSEEGIAYKLYDIIQDNISTFRNSAGNKGFMLEKAGFEGDTTEYDNVIYDELEDLEDEIDKMIDKLDEKEDYYYSQFTAMETYISNMNAQLSALQSMLG